MTLFDLRRKIPMTFDFITTSKLFMLFGIFIMHDFCCKLEREYEYIALILKNVGSISSVYRYLPNI